MQGGQSWLSMHSVHLFCQMLHMRLSGQSESSWDKYRYEAINIYHQARVLLTEQGLQGSQVVTSVGLELEMET